MPRAPKPALKPTPPSGWQELRAILSPKTSVLFMASLLTPAAAFMLYPFLTIYFTHTLGMAIAVAGTLLSVRFLATATLSFVGGWASDRYGLVPVYVLAGVVTAVALWLMAYEHSGVVLALLLVVLGISAATVNANVRGLANLGVPAAHRATVQNYVHWLNNVGMAMALPFSAFLLHAGSSRLPFFVAAGGYLAMAAVVAWGFRSDAAPSSVAATGSNPWTIVRATELFASSWPLFCCGWR
ncbi:MAG: MFS transporter [Thermaerobacter sp.]|nr:MFS transporter [Thermaerobacter sp.]